MITPAPITAYLGVNGSGKSLSGVAFAVRDQQRTGRLLVTNMVGLSVDHHHIDSVEELPELLPMLATAVGSKGRPVGVNILLDEAGAMFASRDTGRNKAFEKTCQQLRKYRSRLLWTAPTFSRADKILREVTLMAILCRPLIKKHVAGDPWPSTRLVAQKSFDVSRLDTSGTSINKNARAKKFGLVRTATWQDQFDSWGSAGLPDEKRLMAIAPQPESTGAHRLSATR